MNNKLVSLLVGSTLLVTTALADEPLKRHGVVTDTDRAVQIEGGFTATLQSSNDSRVNDEATASFDLVAKIPNGKGKWIAYIEGNLSPRLNGISSVLGEANGDAGSALDRDGKGRMQVSELHYSRTFGKDSMTVGLLNPACVFDSSEVANDETAQFLGASFVNNPAIAFPDYTLGACVHFEEGKSRPGINLLLTSSHGLGDNPNVSYSELFDINADGKGVFIGAELYKTISNSQWRVGVWTSTADHSYLDGSGNIGNNYGIYLTTDHKLGNSNINLRLGMANDEVSEAANFASIAVEIPIASQTLGVGLSQTGLSDKVGTGKDDMKHTEVYLRFDINDSFHITPSVQLIQNSGFDNTGSSFDKDMAVYSVRASYAF